ncbi:unnamed protein product [Ilex paraguariensis]|uniref:Myb/SANT-like DNA-binding domain-containing protein n=1 Tax=Ilex paraguariensis TaxID=185542 RepID=A0ABC8TE90_9AQUA
MEPNGLPGGMFSRMGSGMLGLEMSLQHHQNHIPPQNPHDLQQHHRPMVAYGHREIDRHQQTQQSVKQGQPYATDVKNTNLTLSDEDEPGLTAEDSGGDGKKKMSPWRRMKWTDSMVRLLIMVVFYIGDEAGSEGNDPTGKKKGGVLQKKGKWKSVSRAMMERGFYVSPQQCEDKFNDLNKRYKRVNDILGKGTSCRVVENQSLLDTMDHVSLKMKEEVKKLLNSKHLFFREMCAYHNSCGHGAGGSGAGAGGCSGNGGTGGDHHSLEVAAEPSENQQQSQQQGCLHSSENAPIVPNSGRAETEVSKMAKVGSGEHEDDDGDDDGDEDEDEEDDDDEDDEVLGGGAIDHVLGGGAIDHGHDEEDDTDERSSRKRQKKEMFTSPIIQQLSTELQSVVQDGRKTSMEKREWVKTRLMQLEEQRVAYQMQAYELEKQRVKWLKFRTKKEREMEKEKLLNERMRLENDRMHLIFRQKGLDLFDLQQQQEQQSINKRSAPAI